MTQARGLRAYTILCLVFLYAPIALLPLFAFNESSVIAFPLSGFTVKWFQAMWNDDQLFRAMWNSLIVSGSTAVIATCFGVLAGRAYTRYGFPLKGGIVGLIMLPMVLPNMIIAMSILVVLLAIGIPLSLWTIVLGHVLICIPFAVTIMSTAFHSLDRSLEEAARDLGESPASAFRLIVLPLVTPGIISSLLMCFTISLDEFVIAFFLGGTNTPLAAYIYGQFRFPARVPTMLALGSILVLVSVILLGLAEYFRRRGLARIAGKDAGGVW
jgi:spermidine/putrescine transport system permease protein